MAIVRFVVISQVNGHAEFEINAGGVPIFTRPMGKNHFETQITAFATIV